MSEKRKSSRRDFLSGKSAADTLGDIIDDSIQPQDDEQQSNPSASPRETIQYTRQAMACKFEVLVNAAQYSESSAAAIESLDLVDQLEDQLSVFRPDSEVSQINRDAADELIEVEARLFELLQTAVLLYRETEGAFDITAGPLSKLWGFYRRQGNLPSQEDIGKSLQAIGSQHISLNEAESTIHFLRPDVEINLGAIGKGHALDRCADCMIEHGVYDFMLHGGNSSILALGNEATGNENQQGWTVGLMNPLRPGRRIGQIQLTNAAMGTSGTSTQFFRHEGKRYGHILDPRTGWPADGVLSVSVVAETAAEADALATAFYVMGIEAASQYCEKHEEIAMVMTTAGKKAGSLDIHQLGFGENQLEIF